MTHYSLRKLKKIVAGGREPVGFREHLEGCAECQQLLDLARAAAGGKPQAAPQATAAHLSFEALMGLLGGALSAKERQRAEAHLAVCDQCRRELAELTRAASALEAGTHVQAAPGRMRRARELWTLAQPTSAADRRRRRVSHKNPMAICIVVDDSTSMAGDSARDVTDAIRDFLVMLQAACHGQRSYFSILLVKFGDFAHVVQDFTPVLDVDPNEIEFSGASGGTDMAAALELVFGKLSDATRQVPPVPPLVLFCSDGSNSGADPLPWADRIKDLKCASGEPSFLVTCGFGEADKALLQKIATSPSHYKDLASPFELRQFLAEIGSTVTSLATEGQTPATLGRRLLTLIGQVA